mgnify:CR=1 FL=1
MEKNKKLIVFIPSIEDGGVEKNLYLIANYLSNKINKINVITYENSKKNFFHKKIKFINPLINNIKFKSRYPKYFLCLITLFRILLLNKNCLVLCFQANIFSIILCKMLSVKIITRSNSSSEGWSQNYLKQKIFSIFFPMADKIIVNSYDFKREMDKRYKINTHCILNPFDFSIIKKKSDEKIKNPFSIKKSLKLISVGRLTYQKDFITILKAIKLIKRNVELIILGKGNEYLNLRNFIDKNNLSKKVKLLGYKTNPFKYIKKADILILSSIFEGSPNVLVEAQFLRKFIISTNCPTGPKEILDGGNYGELINIKDYRHLANIIEKFSFTKKNKRKIQYGYTNHKQYKYKLNCKKYFKLIMKFL